MNTKSNDYRDLSNRDRAMLDAAICMGPAVDSDAHSSEPKTEPKPSSISTKSIIIAVAVVLIVVPALVLFAAS